MSPEGESGRTVDLVTLGETMALLSPDAVGPLRHVRQLQLSIGGAESNVAIGASRLGLSTAWMGRVGDDELGRLVLRELRAEGVSVHARSDASAPTGLMIKERRGGGLSSVLYYRKGSAGSGLSVEDIDADLVSGAGILHLTGITPALSATALEAVRAALAVARRAGVTVSVDLNFRRSLWSPEEFGSTMLSLLGDADVVFASPDEAEHLVGRGGPEDQARALARHGPAQAVIKLGADGAVAVVDGEHLASAAMAVDVVDTIGAGDAFVAGWLAELSRGESPERRLGTATMCGGLACTVRGDWEGLPTPAELDVLRDENRIDVRR